ncbi:enoyl-CoA hydratase-related protein [Acuticoccus sediminis]|uniref:enoyl-CoA hydratase-related protein n=1 Tax=Acuticoccus sediminis TaxID=2184697 RepID=UPI001CFEF9FA|nr:enoyl-CoA hydratase-related protein [Acuticoccus sediminis]
MSDTDIAAPATTFPPEWRPQREFGEGRVGLSIDGPVAVAAIQVPGKMNALDDLATAGLIEALTVAEAEARVFVLTGIGGRAFISGADIEAFDDEKRGPSRFMERQQRLAASPLPTIAAIRGYCLGGGLMTALNCDLRVAGADAQFGVPAARLGIAYGYDGLKRLVETVGPSRTRRLLYVGDRIDAATALAWGLVDEMHGPDALWGAAMALARRIAGNAPLSVKASKATIAEVLADPATRDLARIEELSLACRESADFREGRRAFLEKRPPVFEGR